MTNLWCKWSWCGRDDVKIIEMESTPDRGMTKGLVTLFHFLIVHRRTNISLCCSQQCVFVWRRDRRRQVSLGRLNEVFGPKSFCRWQKSSTNHQHFLMMMMMMKVTCVRTARCRGKKNYRQNDISSYAWDYTVTSAANATLTCCCCQNVKRKPNDQHTKYHFKKQN